MIIDAMSKWKTSVPHFARPPNSISITGVPLQYQLMGSKIHGFANVADFQYGGQIAGAGSGSNSMCSIMLSNLHLIQNRNGEIPPHLCLQLDNCAKDNKNHTLLGFVALLVQLGIVQTVQVSYYITTICSACLTSSQLSSPVRMLSIRH